MTSQPDEQQRRGESKQRRRAKKEATRGTNRSEKATLGRGSDPALLLSTATTQPPDRQFRQ